MSSSTSWYLVFVCIHVLLQWPDDDVHMTSKFVARKWTFAKLWVLFGCRLRYAFESYTKGGASYKSNIILFRAVDMFRYLFWGGGGKHFRFCRLCCEVHFCKKVSNWGYSLVPSSLRNGCDELCYKCENFNGLVCVTDYSLSHILLASEFCTRVFPVEMVHIICTCKYTNVTICLYVTTCLIWLSCLFIRQLLP